MLTPFGTCIEIENFETLAEILKEIAERSKTEGIKRLVIDVSLDIRFDKQISLESKVRSVEEKLR
uniref:Thiamine-binding protein domain-containing protein n=1 Tax=Ignisphaera aggregans TaxID=334771 RepID=A0A7C2ZVD2_9CREN